MLAVHTTLYTAPICKKHLSFNIVTYLSNVDYLPNLSTQILYTNLPDLLKNKGNNAQAQKQRNRQILRIHPSRRF